MHPPRQKGAGSIVGYKFPFFAIFLYLDLGRAQPRLHILFSWLLFPKGRLRQHLKQIRFAGRNSVCTFTAVLLFLFRENRVATICLLKNEFCSQQHGTIKKREKKAEGWSQMSWEREGEGERGSAPRGDKNNDETFTTWKRKQVGDFKIGKWGARDKPRENTHVLYNKCWQKPNNESPYLLSVQIFRHISCSSDLQTTREGQYFNQLHFRGEHNTGINQIWCRSSRSVF